MAHVEHGVATAGEALVDADELPVARIVLEEGARCMTRHDSQCAELVSMVTRQRVWAKAVNHLARSSRKSGSRVAAGAAGARAARPRRLLR